jgi:hypothetical protein
VVGTNEAIPDHVDYIFSTINDVAIVVRHFGDGTLLIVLDVKSAYKNIGVSAADLHLHGELDPALGPLLQTRQQWGNKAAGYKWIDAALLFAHILVYSLLLYLVYFVDDFIIVVPPLVAPDGTHTPDFARAHQIIRDVCAIAKRLNLRLAKFQLGTRVQYLGYLIDSSRMTLTIPPRWCRLLLTDLERLVTLRSVRVRVLQSITGQLARVATVLPRVRQPTRFLHPLTHTTRLGPIRLCASAPMCEHTSDESSPSSGLSPATTTLTSCRSTS